MAIHNSRKHRYETFFGIYNGLTWIKEREYNSFCIRLSGRYTSNFEFLRYRKKFDYTIESKQQFSSCEEAESHLEGLLQKGLVQAMAKAKKSTLWNAFELHPTFVVF